MAKRRSRPLRSLTITFLLLGGLVAGYTLSHYGSSLVPGGGLLGSEPDVVASPFLDRNTGPAFSLAEAEEPLDLSYLQQFCPTQPDLAAPTLCNLEPDQAESLAQSISPEALACWQQIYDYAFGPLANQPYLGGNPPVDPAGGEGEGGTPGEVVETDCHQGAITVLVQPGFVSQIEADNNDAARFQDILFIMAAIIEYEAYRLDVPDNWSNLDGSVNFSYYQSGNINQPGTWNAYPATTGAVLSLSSNPTQPNEIGVDPETNELLLPTTGRWGDADQAGDPELLLIFHRADCTEGSVNPVALGGLHRYAVVYRPSGEDGFNCHGF